MVDRAAWPASAQRSRLLIAGTERRRASLPPFAAFLLPSSFAQSHRVKPPCRTDCPLFQPGWLHAPRCWRSCLCSPAHAQDQAGRAPLHRAGARQQRRANRLLHGADRFRPLSASPISPCSCVTTAARAARQRRPRRRDRRLCRSDQAQSRLCARLCRPRQVCGCRSTTSTARSPTSTPRSGSTRTMPAPT